MENFVSVGEEYIQTALAWLQDSLNTNPQLFVVVVYIGVFFVVFLALKELFDIATGSNKSALKREVEDLSSENQALLEKVKSLKYDLAGQQDHANALADKLAVLKAIKFDEVFTAECLKELFDKAEKEEEKKEALEEPEENENSKGGITITMD